MEELLKHPSINLAGAFCLYFSTCVYGKIKVIERT